MYELVFWKYIDGVYLNNHLVYEAILNNEIVEGLDEIPIIIILNRIQNSFSDWEKVDENSWKNSIGSGAFQIKFTAQSVKIDCYGTQGKHMEMLVNIIEEFKYLLYDQQIPIRYDEFQE